MKNTLVVHMFSAWLKDLSPEQRKERQSRICNIRRLTGQIAKAKQLAIDRDSGKRKFDTLRSEDQQLLEDFDTGKLHKRKKANLAPRGSAFRLQLSSASAAAEHAAASSSTDIKKE